MSGRRGVRTWASEGNFVFWQVEGDANVLAARFAAHRIGVRAFSGLTGIGEALRLGVAPWERLRRLASIVEELWP